MLGKPTAQFIVSAGTLRRVTDSRAESSHDLHSLHQPSLCGKAPRLPKQHLEQRPDVQTCEPVGEVYIQTINTYTHPHIGTRSHTYTHTHSHTYSHTDTHSQTHRDPQRHTYVLTHRHTLTHTHIYFALFVFRQGPATKPHHGDVLSLPKGLLYGQEPL